MAAQPKHKDAIISAAARLFRVQGFVGTGLAEILAASGAPKGSFYHYFPGGKADVAVAAIELAAGSVTAFLERLASESENAGDLLRRYAALAADGLKASGWVAGCPIATTLLEVGPQEEAITAAGRAAFGQWAAVFERALIASGADAVRARPLSILAISTIEGALIQARVQQSELPLTEGCAAIADLFDIVAAS